MTRTPRAVVDALRTGVYERCFTPDAHGGAPRVGAEVEFLALDSLTRRPVPLYGLEHGLLALVRRHAASAGWTESQTAYGTPRFDLPGRATLTFEPGGQVEIATVACQSASSLLDTLDAVVSPLRVGLARDGVMLVAQGIDPCTPIDDIELQLHVDRYERMTRYFDRIGPFGARMMRQTAAVQISVDRGARPHARWRLLNDLAPYVVALFANSPCYAGVSTGHGSYRAHCWRMLDGTRTGVAAQMDDPSAGYTNFALGAVDMMRATATGEHLEFGDWIAAGAWTLEGWERHLTTLFPEVRARGHFELRSCDSIDPALYPALVSFVCGLVYDPAAAAEAAELTAGSASLLVRAGREGLADPEIARTTRSLCDLALRGAARLGTPYLRGDDLEIARELLADLNSGDSKTTPQPLPRRTPASVHVV